jgi:hypothetical protein
MRIITHSEIEACKVVLKSLFESLPYATSGIIVVTDSDGDVACFASNPLGPANIAIILNTIIDAYLRDCAAKQGPVKAL